MDMHTTLEYESSIIMHRLVLGTRLSSIMMNMYCFQHRRLHLPILGGSYTLESDSVTPLNHVNVRCSG
jgi:hypothetical protein